jgi:hypothetical protein
MRRRRRARWSSTAVRKHASPAYSPCPRPRRPMLYPLQTYPTGASIAPPGPMLRPMRACDACCVYARLTHRPVPPPLSRRPSTPSTPAVQSHTLGGPLIEQARGHSYSRHGAIHTAGTGPFIQQARGHSYSRHGAAHRAGTRPLIEQARGHSYRRHGAARRLLHHAHRPSRPSIHAGPAYSPCPATRVTPRTRS